MEQGSVFQSNRSQAVKTCPKAVALPDDVKRVDVVVVGRARIITPAGESWDSWFDGEGVTADFMAGVNSLPIRSARLSDAQVHARHQHLHLHHQNRPQEVREAFLRHHDQMCISTVTLMELIYGAESPRTPRAILQTWKASLLVWSAQVRPGSCRPTGQLALNWPASASKSAPMTR